MQQRQQKSVPGVIFDSDMGANVDAALALALLYSASSKVKVIGVTVTNPSLEAVAFCEVVGRFYASGGKLNSTPSHYNMPIGFAGDGKAGASPMLAKAVAATWNPVEDISDTAEVGIIFRNALTSQKDGEGIVVAAGPLTNLVRALALPGNKELAAAKVGLLVVGAGSFGGGAVDPRVKADVAAAKRMVAEWSGQVVFVGTEVGAAVPYPGASITADFAWAEKHPVVEAYKAYKPGAYDAPSQAVLAALYATSPKDEMFQLSQPGKVEVLDDGATKFTPSALGKHQYLIAQQDAAWKERVTKAFTTLASTKPTTPAPRFRPQQNAAQQQVKAEAPAQP